MLKQQQIFNEAACLVYGRKMMQVVVACVEFALPVENFSFSGGGAGAEVGDVCFATDLAGF